MAHVLTIHLTAMKRSIDDVAVQVTKLLEKQKKQGPVPLTTDLNVIDQQIAEQTVSGYMHDDCMIGVSS